MFGIPRLGGQIHASVEQRRLVGSIIEIGKSLGIKVVAEGVETREHVCILRDLDCDILQGYALARPMAFSDVEPFMMSQIWRQDDSHSVHDLQTRLRQRAQR